MATDETARHVDALEHMPFDARAGAPDCVLDAGRRALGEAGEEAREGERHEGARSARVIRVVAARAGLDVGADQLNRIGRKTAHEHRRRRGVDVGDARPRVGREVQILVEHRTRAVAGARPIEKAEGLGFAIPAPALKELARHRSGAESGADADLLVVDLEILPEAEFVPAQGRRRITRTDQLVGCVSEKRRDDGPGQKLEVDVHEVPGSIPRLLTDRRAERIGEAGERAELIEVAIGGAEAIGAREARVEPQGSGGAGPELGAVDPEAIEDRETIGLSVLTDVDAAHEKPFALVDLRAIGLLAAAESEKAVAHLDVERNRLGPGDAGRKESPDESRGERGGLEGGAECSHLGLSLLQQLRRTLGTVHGDVARRAVPVARQRDVVERRWLRAQSPRRKRRVTLETLRGDRRPLQLVGIRGAMRNVAARAVAGDPVDVRIDEGTAHFRVTGDAAGLTRPGLFHRVLGRAAVRVVAGHARERALFQPVRVRKRPEG